MKLKLVAVAVTSMLAAGVVNAAEIYNKDGNKLDLYGKVTGLHYFSDDAGADGDKTYMRIGFKGETGLTTSCPVTANGNTRFRVTRTKATTSPGPVWPSQV